MIKALMKYTEEAKILHWFFLNFSSVFYLFFSLNSSNFITVNYISYHFFDGCIANAVNPKSNIL